MCIAKECASHLWQRWANISLGFAKFGPRLGRLRPNAGKMFTLAKTGRNQATNDPHRLTLANFGQTALGIDLLLSDIPARLLEFIGICMQMYTLCHSCSWIPASLCNQEDTLVDV